MNKLFFIKYSNKKGQKYYNHTFATICDLHMVISKHAKFWGIPI